MPVRERTSVGALRKAGTSCQKISSTLARAAFVVEVGDDQLVVVLR